MDNGTVADMICMSWALASSDVDVSDVRNLCTHLRGCAGSIFTAYFRRSLRHCSELRLAVVCRAGRFRQSFEGFDPGSE